MTVILRYTEPIPAKTRHPGKAYVLAGLGRDDVIGQQRRVGFLRALLRRGLRLDPAGGRKLHRKDRLRSFNELGEEGEWIVQAIR